jgi:hypothetical protein
MLNSMLEPVFRFSRNMVKGKMLPVTGLGGP